MTSHPFRQQYRVAAKNAGKATACTITLKKGTGSCKLSSKRLKKTTYRLVAVYPGNADYGPSTSAPRTLRVIALSR